MSAFPFVPRSLPRASQSRQPRQPRASLRDDRGRGRAASGEYETGTAGPATPAKRSDVEEEDLVTLVSLALSDYAVWSDPDLRRKIDWSSEEDGKDGFISLGYLLRTSSALSAVGQTVAQSVIIRALRSRASESIEVRMLITSPPASVWGQSSVLDDGGYEIRRKNWASLSETLPTTRTKAYWEERTAYLEQIPPTYHTVASIVRFTKSLLEHDLPSPPRVEHVSLPAHHQDLPGATPRCKGFALVTLSDAAHVEALLAAWPWNRRPLAVNGHGPVRDEASRFGFRTLSKEGWDRLNEDYLAYRQRLVQELASGSDEHHPTGEPVHTPSPPSSPVPDPAPPPQTTRSEPQPAPSRPMLSADSPYPPDCLLFVRNIHAETNKTTLRALFARAFSNTTTNASAPSEGLDYVDYTKGMDSCHLRAATPAHALALHAFLSEHARVQTHGLDDTGTPPPVGAPAPLPLRAEIVHGKREEVYWERVPDKVRRQAVRRAIELGECVRDDGGDEGDHHGADKASRTAEDVGRRRKRQRT